MAEIAKVIVGLLAVVELLYVYPCPYGLASRRQVRQKPGVRFSISHEFALELRGGIHLSC